MKKQNHPTTHTKSKGNPPLVKRIILYPTHTIAYHMFGKNHSHSHRMGVGTGVMAVGVIIASSAHMVPYHAIQLILDGIGYAIHGIGASPYVEWIILKIKSEDEVKSENIKSNDNN